MNQEELNRELDRLLEELIFNGDITGYEEPSRMKEILLSLIHDENHMPVAVTEEQWNRYAVHCLEVAVENSSRRPNKSWKN